MRGGTVPARTRPLTASIGGLEFVAKLQCILNEGLLARSCKYVKLCQARAWPMVRRTSRIFTSAKRSAGGA